MNMQESLMEPKQYPITQKSLINALQAAGIQGPYCLSSLAVVSAQYLADFEDNSEVDDIIAKWGRIFNKNAPDHSHSEIGFWIIDNDGKEWLVFYSSTSRSYFSADGVERTGTRWILGRELLKNPERWDLYINVHYKRTEIMDMLQRADDECGKPYDWTGIGGFGSLIDFTKLRVWYNRVVLKRPTLKAWYCSRIAQYVETGNIIRISPMRRTSWMLKNGWRKAERVGKSWAKH